MVILKWTVLDSIEISLQERAAMNSDPSPYQRALTSSNSEGRSLPSLISLFMEMNCSTVGYSHAKEAEVRVQSTARQFYLVFHIGVVQAGVQHNDGKADDVASICREYYSIHSWYATLGDIRGCPGHGCKVLTCIAESSWVTIAISLCEGLHHAINFLCFPRELETAQESSVCVCICRE